jgi:hypothetical protein
MVSLSETHLNYLSTLRGALQNDATFKASSPRDDKRCGVVWHTQGSGKSLTMAFYTGKLVLTLDTLPLWY